MLSSVPNQVISVAHLTCLAVFFMLTECSSPDCSLVSSWGYEKRNGPTTWAQSFITCSGQQQSPLELSAAAATSGPPPSLLWKNYARSYKMTLLNNGKTVKLQSSWKKGLQTAENGKNLLKGIEESNINISTPTSPGELNGKSQFVSLFLNENNSSILATTKSLITDTTKFSNASDNTITSSEKEKTLTTCRYELNKRRYGITKNRYSTRYSTALSRKHALLSTKHSQDPDIIALSARKIPSKGRKQVNGQKQMGRMYKKNKKGPGYYGVANEKKSRVNKGDMDGLGMKQCKKNKQNLGKVFGIYNRSQGEAVNGTSTLALSTPSTDSTVETTSCSTLANVGYYYINYVTEGTTTNKKIAENGGPIYVVSSYKISPHTIEFSSEKYDEENMQHSTDIYANENSNTNASPFIFRPPCPEIKSSAQEDNIQAPEREVPENSDEINYNIPILPSMQYVTKENNELNISSIISKSDTNNKISATNIVNIDDQKFLLSNVTNSPIDEFKLNASETYLNPSFTGTGGSGLENVLQTNKKVNLNKEMSNGENYSNMGDNTWINLNLAHPSTDSILENNTDSNFAENNVLDTLRDISYNNLQFNNPNGILSTQVTIPDEVKNYNNTNFSIMFENAPRGSDQHSNVHGLQQYPWVNLGTADQYTEANSEESSIVPYLFNVASDELDEYDYTKRNLKQYTLSDCKNTEMVIPETEERINYYPSTRNNFLDEEEDNIEDILKDFTTNSWDAHTTFVNTLSPKNKNTREMKNNTNKILVRVHDMNKYTPAINAIMPTVTLNNASVEYGHSTNNNIISRNTLDSVKEDNLMKKGITFSVTEDRAFSKSTKTEKTTETLLAATTVGSKLTTHANSTNFYDMFRSTVDPNMKILDIQEPTSPDTTKSSYDENYRDKKDTVAANKISSISWVVAPSRQNFATQRYLVSEPRKPTSNIRTRKLSNIIDLINRRTPHVAKDRKSMDVTIKSYKMNSRQCDSDLAMKKFKHNKNYYSAKTDNWPFTKFPYSERTKLAKIMPTATVICDADYSNLLKYKKIPRPAQKYKSAILNVVSPKEDRDLSSMSQDVVDKLSNLSLTEKKYTTNDSEFNKKHIDNTNEIENHQGLRRHSTQNPLYSINHKSHPSIIIDIERKKKPNLGIVLHLRKTGKRKNEKYNDIDVVIGNESKDKSIAKNPAPYRSFHKVNRIEKEIRRRTIDDQKIQTQSKGRSDEYAEMGSSQISNLRLLRAIQNPRESQSLVKHEPWTMDETWQTTPQLHLGDDVFVLDSIHFHWGANDSLGSEHKLNGIRFPLEMNAVHQRRRPAEAGVDTDPAKDPQLIVAQFFQVCDHCKNDGLEILTKRLREVRTAGTSTEMVVPLDALVVPFQRSFYLYHGSLTTPPCTECATYIVSRTVAMAAPQQIAHFRELLDCSGEPLVNNFRPLQPKNGRKIFFID